MARGKQLTSKITEECTVFRAKEEFYKNNKAKGLAEETQKGYISYIDSFAEWCGYETLVSDINVKLLDEYLYFKSNSGVKDITLKRKKVAGV